LNLFNIKKLLIGALAFGMVAPAGAVTLSNNTTGFVDSANTTRDIVFSAGDFAGVSPTINGICVAVSFAKYNGSTFIAETTTPPYGNTVP